MILLYEIIEKYFKNILENKNEIDLLKRLLESECLFWDRKFENNICYINIYLFLNIK